MFQPIANVSLSIVVVSGALAYYRIIYTRASALHLELSSLRRQQGKNGLGLFGQSHFAGPNLFLVSHRSASPDRVDRQTGCSRATVAQLGVMAVDASPCTQRDHERHLVGAFQEANNNGCRLVSGEEDSSKVSESVKCVGRTGVFQLPASRV